MHTQKILARLLSSPRSYSLPKSTTYTVVKSQFLGLQLGVIFDSSCATAAQAATVEHESDRP
jgi:hypothetical protein